MNNVNAAPLSSESFKGLGLRMRSLAGALAFTVVTSIGAGAGEFRPAQAQSIELGPIAGVAYYTVEQGALRIVATLAVGETGRVLRVASTLGPDEEVVLSIPGEEGGAETAVMFQRRGDQLYVSDASLSGGRQRRTSASGYSAPAGE